MSTRIDRSIAPDLALVRAFFAAKGWEWHELENPD
jgi:hypothetical protein